jgi:hypothetical protein
MSMLCAGRLDTGSRIAAQSLAGSIESARLLLDSGVLIQGTLFVQHRGTGAKQYVYPELTIDGEADASALRAGSQMSVPALGEGER